jgi:RNA polymerase sigma-70 factor (ECF subfamily)
VNLAVLSALQFLPGRQRAALILRDVLDWNAAEVADLLEVSAAAANSALQRARATLESRRTEMLGISARPTDAAHLQVILERYVTAWEASDTRLLVELLHEQAILTMPPLPAWFRGRAHIQQFLATNLFAGQPAGLFRLQATSANGCPAFASYRRDDAGIYRPAALHVLTIADEQIVEIDDFLALDDHLFARFGLPARG